LPDNYLKAQMFLILYIKGIKRTAPENILMANKIYNEEFLKGKLNLA
jgi:hypothetical protein